MGIITGGGYDEQYTGLTPGSEVVFGDINTGSLGTRAANKEAGRKILRMAVFQEVTVLNASWEYQRIDDIDPIMQAIGALDDTVLFVVAAGNNGQNVPSGALLCTWDPACLSALPNVLSVIGLTADEPPAVYNEGTRDGSNYGTQFSLGAIGEDVVSSTIGDRVGPMSGTSQAAPQVSATAALLNDYYQSTRPGSYGARSVPNKTPSDVHSGHRP